MQTYLMRQGIESCDYAEIVPLWSEMVKLVQQDVKSERQASLALFFGGASSSSSPPIKKEDEAAIAAAEAKQKAAKKNIAAMVAQSRKAFAILYQALPAELRPLIADVPQGYAFGIWSFLEKKYRNTEQDSIAALWADFTTLAQEADEDFVTYKARVDSVVELLQHAKQVVPSGLYSALALWRLQPRYATAVLTLKAGSRVTDTDKIDWPAIVEYMSQYERAQQGLGEADAERAMAARARMPSNVWQKPPQVPVTQQQQQKPSLRSRSASPHGRRPLSEIECFNCHKKGHYSSRCPSRRKKDEHPASRSKGRPSFRRGAESGASGSSSEEESEPRPATQKQSSQRAHMVRTANRYGALVDHQEVEQYVGYSGARSYAALALAATSGGQSELRERSNAAVTASEKIERPAAPGPAKTKVASLDEALKTTTKAVDSAATVSTTCSRESLQNLRRCPPMPIRMADGSVLSAMHKGDLRMRLPVAGKPDQFVMVTIRDVYYHERFDANLLSWGRMRKNGWEMHSTKAGTYLVTPAGHRVNASTQGNLTTLEDTNSERVYGVSSVKGVVCMTAKELLQLHRRLGHTSWTRLLEMCHTGATVGIGDIRNMSPAELAKAEIAVKHCAACAEAKTHRKALGHHGLDKGTRAGEVLHMDTFYAVTRDATSGKKSTRYCLLAVDAFNEWRWSDTHSSIADLPQAAVDIMQHSHNLTGRYPRLLIADLGSEFQNKTMREFCRKHGIQYQPSPARAKELNGLAEKNVDTMKNHARAMLSCARMSDSLGWQYAIQHYVYVWNRTHIGQHTRVTPYQSMTGRESSVLNLGEFGCDVYVHQHRLLRDTTFGRKAEPGIYLGHSGKGNCPQVLMLRSGKIVLSKDVHFREGSFLHLRALSTGHPHDVEPVDLGVMHDESGARAGQFDSAPFDMDDLDQPLPDRDREEQKYLDAADEVIESKKYELKAITDVRDHGGIKQYRCKWTGYAGATWEPASVIQEDAPVAVQEYEALVAGRAAAVQNRPYLRSSGPVPKSKAVTFADEISESGESDEDNPESESASAAAYAAKCL